MSNIRAANISDLEPLALLFDQYRQFYEQTPDIILAKNFIAERLNKQDSVILVAENAAQKLIGFCQIYPSFCSVAAAKLACYTIYLLILPHEKQAQAAL